MAKLIKNFLYTAASQLLNLFVPLITIPYLSRVLGPQSIGYFSYENSIAFYFSIFILLGLENYGNRTIAQVKNDVAKLSKTFWELYIMQLMIGIVIVITFSIFCCMSADDNILRWIMIISLISYCIDINWFYYGLEKFNYVVIRNFVVKIVTTALILVFVKEPNDIIIYTLLIISGTFIGNLLLWPAVLSQKCNLCDLNIIQHIKPNLILFIPIISVSLYKYIDKIMLGFLCPIEELGYYEYSEKIIQIPISLVNALGIVMLPRVSSIVSTNKDATEYIEKSIILVTFISTALGFGMMSVAQEFVPIFYGYDFMPCVLLFYILLPAGCFISFSSVIRTQYLIPMAKESIFVKSVVWGGVFNLLLNLILIPQFQSKGAAVGTLMVEIFVCAYQVVRVSKSLPVYGYIKKITPFVVAGGMMFLILIYSESLLSAWADNLYSIMTIKIILGPVIYFSVLLLFRVDFIYMIKNVKYI